MTERVELDMACTCRDAQKEEYKERRARTIEVISRGAELLVEQEEFLRDHYLTAIVMELEHWGVGWSFNIASVYADMWLGVSVKGMNYTTKEEAHVYIQCDTLEDGLTDIFLYLRETYPVQNDDDEVK